jgi:hypothetical protein
MLSALIRVNAQLRDVNRRRQEAILIMDHRVCRRTMSDLKRKRRMRQMLVGERLATLTGQEPD